MPQKLFSLKIMSDIDVHLRLEELKYYENVTNNLTSKFNELVKKYEFITSQESLKVRTAVSSSTSTEISGETICAECLTERNHNSFKRTYNVPRRSSSEDSICKHCVSESNPNDYSSIWLLSRTEKVKVYENAISKGGHLTEPEMTISFNDGLASSTSDDKKTFAEITKYKRDIKRKRMKYRTTKAPPLTHTEELRNLISLQMELWEQFCCDGKESEKSVVKLPK